MTTKILIINVKQSDHSVRYMCLEPVYGGIMWIGEKGGAALKRGVMPVGKWKIAGDRKMLTKVCMYYQDVPLTHRAQSEVW